MTEAIDQPARDRAASPDCSAIVQAPAGSGKTSLLTLRFLRLLGCVDEPDEIVAITFTRKAAAEMRHRITEALQHAALSNEPGDAAASPSARAARAALDRSRERGWQLESHVARLRILTIDGLNHLLARRLPLSAGLGGAVTVADDASDFYMTAARRLLSRLEAGDATAEAVERVLSHVDASAGQFVAAIAALLAKRELWLPRVLGHGADPAAARAEIDAALTELARSECRRVAARLPLDVMQEALATLIEAARLPTAEVGLLDGFVTAPGRLETAHPDVDLWRKVADRLLTGKGSGRSDRKLRLKVDVRSGFPPTEKALKSRHQKVLSDLAAADALDCLHELIELPPMALDDQQWIVIRDLLTLLPQAAAELDAVFTEERQVDHTAVAAAARIALGSDDEPTDLALALDARIRHLLVDEFQDTSRGQHRLLSQLLAGWAAGDGRTLFCVGDPMQSIYRFREAEVALFQQAQQHGIGAVPLVPLQLQRNFRSCRAIIDWVNATFTTVMPEVADLTAGAVPYAASVATRDNEPGAGVQAHWLVASGPDVEARLAADLARRALAEFAELPVGPGGARKVAILARTRTHLPLLVEALKEAKIDFGGVELESLGQRPAMRDLAALTAALLHEGDRAAMLAVLRAPWCGLTVAALHALAAAGHRQSLESLLAGATLDADSRDRASRVFAELAVARRDLGRRPLATVVQSAWLALGGPATLHHAEDLGNASTYFGALDQFVADRGRWPQPSELATLLMDLKAAVTGSADAPVQVMTMHRAKGLEFDTVILPWLGRSGRSDDRDLLRWDDVALPDGRDLFLLAARGTDGKRDPLEAWIARREQRRQRLELGRLGYVASTRAQRRLHLVGALQPRHRKDGTPELANPQADTLLGVLWPGVQAACEQAFADWLASGAADRRGDTKPVRGAAPLERLVQGPHAGQAPAAVVPERRSSPGDRAVARPEFDWASQAAIAVGVVVHAAIERLVRAGSLPTADALRADAALRRRELELHGLPEADLEPAARRVERSLAALLEHEQGRRLLDGSHRDSAVELALTADLDGELVSIKVDRTFIDEHGVRWIVDWKTSAHEGGDLDGFLANELERYRGQLERYARVMRLYDGDAVKTQRVGLYFPLMQAWRELTPPA